MKILSLFQSDQRSPAWTYSPGGVIWRILFSDSGRIFGESRDHEQKTVSFFCVDERTGAPAWEGKEFDEPWWIGMEAVQHDILLLHEFAKPDLPQHKRIKALDGGTGELLWKNEELSYWFGYRNTVYAYRDLFEKRVVVAVDLRTGEVKESFDESAEELRQLRSLARQEASSNGLVFPEMLVDDHIDPSIGALLRRDLAGLRGTEGIEYIHEQGYLAFNYHIPESGVAPDARLFSNRLSVIDVEEGKRVFATVLAERVKAIIPDSFFARIPYLFFVKEQKTLTAVQLWKS